MRLREVWQEALSGGGDYLLGMGLRRRTERGEGQPDLQGLNREAAARMSPGPPARDVFHFVLPVLRLTAAERRLPRLVVADLSDEEIADEIGVTGHTLKKLWRSVYERIGDTLPEVIAAAPVEPSTGGRGSEKRRHVLQYLRQHPEELRPWV